MLDFILAQKYDFIVLAIVFVILVIFLYRNKKNIHLQPVLKLGNLNIFSMSLVRKEWGITLMDHWAKKYTEWVKIFAYVSIGLGFIGVFLTLLMLIVMIVQMFIAPTQQQVALVLPFTEIPGLGYLTFSHWIIAIFVIATVHEFAHGIVARLFKVPVKNSGIAVFNVAAILIGVIMVVIEVISYVTTGSFTSNLYIGGAIIAISLLIRYGFKHSIGLPLIPAAFVEPDEKKFAKESDIVKYGVLTAGPISNILLAIPFGLLLAFVFAPLAQSMTEPVGFSFVDVQAQMPAEIAGIEPGQIYTHVNGREVTDAQYLLYQLEYDLQPGDTITLGYQNGSEFIQRAIILAESPTQPDKAYMGVIGLSNRRDYIEQYAPWQEIFTWFQELVKWLYIFNIGIGLMNLMPLYITDGGQISKTFFEQLFKNDKKKAMRAWKITCNACLVILLMAFVVPVFF